MRIAVGADHGGFALKPLLIRALERRGHRVLDLGTFSPQPCDYPRIGAKVAEAVSGGRAQRGLLLCRSGGGMAVVANKFPGVRAVAAQTPALAVHSREHNDANILVLGAGGLSPARARAILNGWMGAPFAGGRHARRVRQITAIERRILRARSVAGGRSRMKRRAKTKGV